MNLSTSYVAKVSSFVLAATERAKLALATAERLEGDALHAMTEAREAHVEALRYGVLQLTPPRNREYWTPAYAAGKFEEARRAFRVARLAREDCEKRLAILEG